MVYHALKAFIHIFQVLSGILIENHIIISYIFICLDSVVCQIQRKYERFLKHITFLLTMYNLKEDKFCFVKRPH